MFTFYDMEVFKQDWLAVFISDDGEIIRLHNDRDGLEAALSNIKFLVGFNNHAYDDKIIASILRDIDPYQTSRKIIEGKRFNLRLQKPITLDVMQELRNVSLKEAQANLKRSIIETPIDFNLDRPLTNQEISKVFDYCQNDVLVTKDLFEEREDYFSSKFEIVKEFKLPATNLQKTRANLAAEVFKATPASDKNRLNFMYDERLPKHELPAPVVDFYKEIEKQYSEGAGFAELEKKKMTFHLAGIEHQYGFGGLHAAKENYKGEGNFMQIDISSYYPSLIINNQFIKEIDTFKKIYHTRQMHKLAADPKDEVYKILLNSTYGAMKSKYNKLYNPQMANNIVVNGQLIMTHLICLLENFVELVQTNTDGIIIKYEAGFEKNILKLLELFEKAYDLSFDVDLITKIAQRDVNNYCLQYKDGKIKGVGRFAKFEGGDWERNSLTVIDKALVDYFIHGKKINQTVIELWKNNDLVWFQNVVKAGSYDGMAQEIRENTLFEGSYRTEFKPLQKVNRIFATKDEYLGGVYRTKNNREIKYTKVPYTSESCLVWNDELTKLNKRRLDLNWYIKEIERWLF